MAVEAVNPLLSAGWFSLPAMVVISVLLAVIAVLAVLLAGSRRRERRAADHDGLTGAFNRKAFFERVAAEQSRSLRRGHPLTLAYIDCDNFKPLNDALGHQAGDEALKTIAGVMHSNLRQYDIVARLGGDEFGVLLPETSSEAAPAIIERLREKLGEAMQSHNWPVSFSIGVCTFDEPAESVDVMVQAADRLMYAVKQSGKGKVKYSTLREQPAVT